MTAIAIAIAFVAIVAMCLLFGVWLVRRHGLAALRDGATFLRAIPGWGRRPERRRRSRRSTGSS